MIIGIHQLHYLPWLRYFHKIALSDVFVILDDIQFNKNGWQNRNKIKGAAGEMILTIPVYGKFQQKLDEVKIDNKTDWRKKHWNSLVTCYRKAEYFGRYEEVLKKFYDREWEKLNDINYEMLILFLNLLNIKTKVYRSSQLNIAGEATGRLIDICKKLGGDTYLTGSHAKETYLDETAFAKEGIKLIEQKWTAPTYKQLFKDKGFIPDLSIVDLLFNEGDRSMDILIRSLPLDGGGAGRG